MKYFILCLLSVGLIAQEQPAPTPATQQSQPTTTQQSAPPPPPPEKSQGFFSKLYWNSHTWGAMGFRNDRQKFDEYSSGHKLNSRTTFKNRTSATLKAGVHDQFKHVILGIHGGYGWLLNGHSNEKNYSNGLRESSSFHFDIGAGYFAYVQGSLGYEFKIYRKPSFGFSFVPGVGYRYSHFMNWSRGDKQSFISNPPVFLPPGTTGLTIGHYPRPNEQDWFGPFIDGRIRFYFWKTGQWDLYFQYHRDDFRSKNVLELETFAYNPSSVLILAQRTRMSSVAMGHKACTLLGGTDVRVHLASGWTFGLYFEGWSTWSKSGRLEQRTTVQTIFPAPLQSSFTDSNNREAVYWTAYDVSLFMGYKF